jgi:hypothetical protein
VQDWDEEDYEDRAESEEEELIRSRRKLRGSVKNKNPS